MKKFGLHLALAVAGFVAMSMDTQAQTGVMKVKIDRSFAVGQNWLPAGEYNIRRVDTGGDAPVLLFESDYGSVMVVANKFRENSLVPGTKTEAVLAVENNKYYLKRLSVAGRSYGFEIPGAPAVQAD
jgi:hypothetical protein